MGRIAQRYVELYAASSETEWAVNTRIVEGDDTNRLAAEEAKKALAGFTGSVENIERARKYLERRSELDPMSIRLLERILYIAANHPQTVAELVAWADDHRLPIIGIDNLPGSVPIERQELPERCVLLFGQEGPGLSPAAHDAAETVCSIAQFGSTRSINAGVAAGIAMHAWVRRWA